MKFRSAFAVFLLFFASLLLSACEKQKVVEPPPVDVITKEPYQEHLDELDGELVVPEALDVILTSPQANELLSAPFSIEGKAKGGWYFEASFPVRLLDDKGNELAVVPAQALEDWMQPGYVPFRAVIERFNPGSATTGTLVLEKDNPSGLPEYEKKIEIPVRFQVGETSTVQVFFPNTTKDPEMLDCGKVFSVSRSIPKTPAIARAAIDELLKGPTASEEKQGYITSLHDGIEVQRLVIENGVAMVDFNDQLEFQVGGSCRIQSIRAQIRETLKQFASVKEVVISIDGRTEDILQP